MEDGGVGNELTMTEEIRKAEAEKSYLLLKKQIQPTYEKNVHLEKENEKKASVKRTIADNVKPVKFSVRLDGDWGAFTIEIKKLKPWKISKI